MIYGDVLAELSNHTKIRLNVQNRRMILKRHVQTEL